MKLGQILEGQLPHPPPKLSLVDGHSFPGSASKYVSPAKDPHLPKVQTLHCSRCRNPYNGPGVVRGANHKGCLASPRGRMGEKPLMECPEDRLRRPA